MTTNRWTIGFWSNGSAFVTESPASQIAKRPDLRVVEVVPAESIVSTNVFIATCTELYLDGSDHVGRIGVFRFKEDAHQAIVEHKIKAGLDPYETEYPDRRYEIETVAVR
jgi:hypothetical protein